MRTNELSEKEHEQVSEALKAFFGMHGKSRSFVALMLCEALSKVLEWDAHIWEIPYLKFPADWEVKLMPPFMGAMLRFHVKKPGMSEQDTVSVYLDVADVLGIVGQPYWEIYPASHGDTERILLTHSEDLLPAIGEALAARVGERAMKKVGL